MKKKQKRTLVMWIITFVSFRKKEEREEGKREREREKEKRERQRETERERERERGRTYVFFYSYNSIENYRSVSTFHVEQAVAERVNPQSSRSKDTAQTACCASSTGRHFDILQVLHSFPTDKAKRPRPSNPFSVSRAASVSPLLLLLLLLLSFAAAIPHGHLVCRCLRGHSGVALG